MNATVAAYSATRYRRAMSCPLALALALLLAATVATAAPCPRGTLTGEVTHVRDGDTILVGTMPIRLNGLAAPEWDEPGGAAAAQAMIGLVYGRTLRCELNGERNHDRCVGVCHLEGVDIAAHLVAAGLARDCPRYSGGRYQGVEELAAMAGATIGRRSAGSVVRVVRAAPCEWHTAGDGFAASAGRAVHVVLESRTPSFPARSSNSARPGDSARASPGG